jgi:hypothetical protein
MITANRWPGRHGRTLAPTALLALALTMPVSACSSGPAAGKTATATLTTAINKINALCPDAEAAP